MSFLTDLWQFAAANPAEAICSYKDFAYSRANFYAFKMKFPDALTRVGYGQWRVNIKALPVLKMGRKKMRGRTKRSNTAQTFIMYMKGKNKLKLSRAHLNLLIVRAFNNAAMSDSQISYVIKLLVGGGVLKRVSRGYYELSAVDLNAAIYEIKENLREIDERIFALENEIVALREQREELVRKLAEAEAEA